MASRLSSCALFSEYRRQWFLPRAECCLPYIRSCSFATGQSRENGFGLEENDASTSSGLVRKRDAIDADEVFEMIRNINDPEHPLTLEQLKVVTVRRIRLRRGRR